MYCQPLLLPQPGGIRLWTWTAILFAVLFLAVSPFLFVRRIVPLAVALICWIAFLAATILWFFGAMISLAVFLS